MKILIKVTKEILERTKNCSLLSEEGISKSCAVAEAVRELFPDASVGYPSLSLSKIDRHYLVCIMPEDMCEFISEFDGNTPSERAKMKPRTFELDVPDAIIQEIGISQVYKILSESKTLEHVNQ